MADQIRATQGKSFFDKVYITGRPQDEMNRGSQKYEFRWEHRYRRDKLFYTF